MHFKNNLHLFYLDTDKYAFLLEVIKWLFSYWPVYQARASATAWGKAEGSCWWRTWYMGWYENSHVITSLSYDRTRLNRKNYLEYVESSFAEWHLVIVAYTSLVLAMDTSDWLLQLAVTTKQRRP